MSTFTDGYKNYIIKQYWDKLKATSEIELKASLAERIFDILDSFKDEFDLDLASYDRLDKIAEIVGLSRAELEQYFELFFGFSDNEYSLPMGYRFSEIESYGHPGETWVPSVTPETGNFQDVCYDPDFDRWVLGNYGGSSKIYVSDDSCQTWSAKPYPNSSCRRMIYIESQGRFVSCCHHGTNRIVISDDHGNTWQTRPTPNTQNYQDLFHAESINRIVAVSTYGGVITSDDYGETWTARTPAELVQWNGVCWSEDLSLFVVVGSGGSNRIMHSPDGINWTSATAPEVNAWTQVCYGDGIFAACAQTGINKGMYSIDGINWTSFSFATGDPVFSIKFSNGRFFAVARDCELDYQYADSSDITSWTGVDIGLGNNKSWYGLELSESMAVCVESDGTNPTVAHSTGDLTTVPIEVNGGKFYDKFLTNTIPGELSEDDFRFYIRAKIAVNATSGYMTSKTVASIQDTIQFLFDGEAVALDNMNMALSLEVDPGFDRGKVFLARDLNLLPRPQGVEYNTILRSGINFFGFDNDDNALGFGSVFDPEVGGEFARLF